ncbi:4Fe-4S binding protein [Aminomonas paucivorans]|uniref:nucleotide-binding protein n=1 Tax=Aminomonas paucivorans TaxID=81412 RepID=UPI00332F9626
MRPFRCVVLSGKGGTGKTCVTSVLAAHFAKRGVFCDADVDAPNLRILLDPQSTEEWPFVGKSVAVLDEKRCTRCGACRDLCRFDALPWEEGPRVDATRCEGCALCHHVCPQEAFSLVPTEQGKLLRSVCAAGTLWHARLKPGGENSGKLVQQVLERGAEEARREGLGLVLVDGPPGVACPVVSSLAGANLVLLVAEPTPAAREDLRRVGDVCARFQVPVGLVVNKANLSPEGTEALRALARERGWPLWGEVPFDPGIPKGLSHRRIPSDHVFPHLRGAVEFLERQVASRAE